MKRITRLLFFAAAVLVAASCGPKYESVKGDPTGARIYTLDNGLKVYMIVNRDQPRIEAQVAVRVGSKNDPQETTGLAHYFEHLMFKGTQQFGTSDFASEEPLLDQIEELFEVYRQTTDEAERTAIYHCIDSISQEAAKYFIPNEYDKLMSAIGSDGTNAYTAYDVTCYVENIPSNQIENWAMIQADRFQNCVLRGFHTELETIYEEYNMYATMDSEKVNEALFAELFKKHTYGTPIIGWQKHLKNPSITNIKKYHDQWYVPNNMAVCLVGDFDPDKTIRIIEKYFGGMKPNKDLKKAEFPAEDPITEPIVREVLGLEAPTLAMAWRFPGANSPEANYLQLLGDVLNNGKAGLIDIDVMQQQRALSLGAGAYSLADYSIFFVEGNPKAGQSLEELRDIALEEIEKVKRGEFDDDLLTSAINNRKLYFMRRIEMPAAMVRAEVDCFINGIEWKDYIHNIDALAAITKEDLVNFVNENFGDNRVEIHKLEKPDPTVEKIAKPTITPIPMNREQASDFLKQIQASEVEPIEPVFVDFNTEMSILKAKSDIPVLYKQNVTNGIFNLTYLFETGTYNDNKIDLASDYISFLGTEEMTAEDIQKELYRLACNFNVQCTGERTYVTVSGLAENMEPALTLLENLIEGAKPNPEALGLLKLNRLQERRNEKLNQRANFRKLQQYILYGAKNNPARDVLSNKALAAVTDEELLERIHGLFANAHEILYYGPLSEDEAIEAVNRLHRVPETLKPLGEANPYQYDQTPGNEVILVNYDANQLYLYGASNMGTKYELKEQPIITMYNNYFSGGMNAIVFQEMREARGLAYSAAALVDTPDDLKHTDIFYKFIATQNDKLTDALSAFDEIINEMPVSEPAFTIAKESLLANYRTTRTVKSSVLWAYLDARKKGLDEAPEKYLYEMIQGLTLDDVVAYQQSHVKGLPCHLGLLGRISDFDLNALAKYGKIRVVKSEDIFGY